MDRQRTVLNKNSKTSLYIFSAIAFLALFGFLFSPFSSRPTNSTFGNIKMGIVHIVMFEFKEDASAEQIKDVRLFIIHFSDVYMGERLIE